MTADLERRLAERGQRLDAEVSPVELNELERRLTPAQRRVHVPQQRRATGLPTRRRGLLVGLASAVAVLVLFGLVLFAGGAGSPPTDQRPAATDTPTTTGVSPEVEAALVIADAFMDAWVAGDSEGAALLFAPDGKYGGGPPTIDSDNARVVQGTVTDIDQLAALHDWYRATGWSFTNLGCRTTDVATPQMEVIVTCDMTFEHELSRSLGWEPVRDTFGIVVDAAGIQSASERSGFDAHVDIWFAFKDWVTAAHPADIDRMYLRGSLLRPRPQTYSADPPHEALNAFPRIDRDAIALWELHVDEFIRSPEAVAAAIEELEFARYIAGAVAVCTEADSAFWAEVAALSRWATENFQQFHIDFADLESNAAWHAAAARHADGVMAKLRSLPIPEGHRDQVEEYFALVDRETDLVRRIAAAAAAGDRALVETLMGDRLEATHRMHNAGFRLGYGLGACPIALPS